MPPHIKSNFVPMEMIDPLMYLCLAALLLLRRKKMKSRFKRKFWIRPINQRRFEEGDFQNLFQQLKSDPSLFHKYTRMSVSQFQSLLRLVGPSLKKKSHRAIDPEQRLAVTLRFLSTEDEVSSVALAYRIGISTAHSIIKEVSMKLALHLGDKYLRPPTYQEWTQIIDGFWENWNFPNCLGAVDGKHFKIKMPPNSGSLYFNYKKYFSIVLLAVCDYRYGISVYNVGSYGSNSDSQIFGDSELYEMLKKGLLNIPYAQQTLPNSSNKTYPAFIGDAIFGLDRFMLTPYSGRFLPEKEQIFNYRLSRARRVSENTFGILTQKWRLYYKTISAFPENVEKFVLATLALHNFLIKKPEELTGESKQLHRVTNIENDNMKYAKWQRDTLTSYFSSPEGAVPWQYTYVRRGNNTME